MLNTISFVLSEIIVLLKLAILLSKSVFFTNSVILGILVWLAKFVYANLEANIYDVNLLNSWISNIFYMIMISSKFLFNFINLCAIITFLTKVLVSAVPILLTFFIIFSLFNIIFLLHYLVYLNKLE